MKVIPNFIENESVAKTIKKILLGQRFDWFYLPTLVDKEDKNDFMFWHNLYSLNDNFYSTHFQQILMPLLGRLSFNYVSRAKINCYPRKQKFEKTKFHTDLKQPHMVALYSVNTNNGYTLFEDGDNKIESVENQMVIFDGRLKHCSVAQTDENIRVNININLHI